MKTRIMVLVTVAFLVSLSWSAATAEEGTGLTAVKQPDRVIVKVGQQVVTEYRFAETQKYPYFYPVNGPQSGKSVTTESSEPYPHHHSLFFGCDKVNGGNYWQDTVGRGRIVSQGVKVIESGGDQVVLEDRCIWVREDAPSPVSDRRLITVMAPSDTLRVIDFDIRIKPSMTVEVERTNHSLFSARMVPELAVTGGGNLVNAQGDRSEKGTFGKASPWCHYSGAWPNTETVEGLAILQHPDNPRAPHPWFTRDYGFFSPSPLNFIDSPVVFQPGGEIRLQYRVIVHAGALDPGYLDFLYETWTR